MKAGVREKHQLIDEPNIKYRALDQLCAAAVDQMLDVLQAPGAQIVEDHHLVPARDQRLREMGAHEAGPPGYQVSRGSVLMSLAIGPAVRPAVAAVHAAVAAVHAAVAAVHAAVRPGEWKVVLTIHKVNPCVVA